MTKKKSKNDITLIGYARVSTADQSVLMQVEALIDYGVKKGNIFSEKMSGAKKKRPELRRALRELREGDTLVVWKLDRIARSLNNLLEVITELEERGIKFRSLTEGVETETPGGRCIIGVMGALAQFERDLIVERTRAGVKAARERGVKFGAEFKVPPAEMPKIWKAVKEQGKTMKSIAEDYGVVPATIKRRLDEYEESLKSKKR